MGQRSQVYIRFEDEYSKDENNKVIQAYHFQWCYGDTLITRADTMIDWLMGSHYVSLNAPKIPYMLAVNQDYNDVVIPLDIFKETMEFCENKENFNLDLFLYQDNNDGCLFIDVNSDSCAINGSVIKYAFANYYDTPEDLMPKPISAEEYMESQDWYWKSAERNGMVERTKEHIKSINENATLMTQDELIEFMTYPYIEGGEKSIKEHFNDLQKTKDEKNIKKSGIERD